MDGIIFYLATAEKLVDGADEMTLNDAECNSSTRVQWQLVPRHSEGKRPASFSQDADPKACIVFA